ncbi:GGDEF domain-containing protein [Bradyrhizobium niftali]|uniref:GGDEF domain-containing protein n=1 Tax=Bradyrhizobium niftali TaxID=2560055 RepID=UPI001F1FEB86|nr:GGDEF domain-containing protein [Bradyrhizobium niftali]
MALRIGHGAKGAGDHVTLSVGVAGHSPGEADGTPDPLLGLAGQALYTAKRLGRDSLPVPGRIARKSASPNTAEAVARPSPIG